MTIFHAGDVVVIEGKHYYYTIRKAYLSNHRLLWRIGIHSNEGGFLDEVVLRNVSGKFVWRQYYHEARHNEWLENGR